MRAAEVEALVSTPLRPGRLGPGSRRLLRRCALSSERGRDLESVDLLRVGREHLPGRREATGARSGSAALAGWHRDFNGARCISVTARPSETTCRSPDVGVRRLRRTLGTALDSSDCTAPLRRLRGLLPPGCEVSHLVECRAPPAGRQRPPVGGAGRSHDKVVES